MTTLGKRLPLLLFVAYLGLTSQAVSGQDRPPQADTSSFASWLDADVGLCLEIDNLADRWQQFAGSSMQQRLRQFPPIAGVLKRHREELAQLGEEIKRRAGATPLEVGKRLFGKKVLFAIWPPANSPNQKPSALLLVDAVDEQFMRRTLENLVAARQQVGRWKGRHTLSVAGGPVSVDVVLPDDEQSEFYIAAVGSVAMLSTSESLLRSVLERRATEGNASSLAASPSYRAANERLAERCVARLFINPRPWDPDLAADLDRKQPGSEQAETQAALLKLWRATQYVAAGLQLTPQLSVEIDSQWDAEVLPEAAREVVAGLAGHSQFLEKIPAESLLAVAVHIDLGHLARSVIARQWQEAAKLSRSDASKHPEQLLFWALSPGLGPNWGFWVANGAASMATPARTKSLPFDVVAAIQTRPLVADGRRPALAESVEPLLHALLAATVEATNRRAGKPIASLTSTDRGGRSTTSVSGMIPGQLQQELSYNVDEGQWFWLGTSAAAMEQAVSNHADDSLWPQLAHQRQMVAGTPTALVYVNLAGWRKLASLGRPAFDFLWAGRPVGDQKKDEQFQTWLTFAQLADRLLFVCHMDESSLHICFGLE